jgi:hypothetical protein
MNDMKSGRPLQLEGLQYEKRKVTVGFKCQPLLKLELANEASKIEMTLSEYIEALVEIRNEEVPVENTGWVEELKTKVAFYENDFIKNAFLKHKGKTIEYRNSHDKNVSTTVNRIEDVYTIIINTIKLG